MFVPIVTLGLLGVTLTAVVRFVEIASRRGPARRTGLTIGRRARNDQEGNDMRLHALRTMRGCCSARWRWPLRLGAGAGSAAHGRLRRRCARSISASRWRRRTSCTPRPTSPRSSGYFAKHCIDANIMQFEGGGSAAANAAAAQGTALVTRQRHRDRPRRQGASRSGAWRRACRRPTWCAADIKTAKDLKGKRLSATGGGVGGFNWLMGREVLKTAGLTVDDAQFISARHRRPAAGPGGRPDRRRGAASRGRLSRQEEEARPACRWSSSPS